MEVHVTEKRSQPTPRNEGMANIIAATLRLLKTRQPQDITLRDVAIESGHGHRLIVEWFGGKGGLYAAVFNEIFGPLRETGQLYAADVPTRSDVKTAMALVNYMRMTSPDELIGIRQNWVSEDIQNRVTTFRGKTRDQASLAVKRLAVLAFGISLWGDFFGLSDEEAIKMMQDEFRASLGLDMPAHRTNTD